MSLHSIQELVRDKDVLLVGNNLTALENRYGYLIDKYDIVVRFGKGIPDNYPDFLGRKTDIWVTGEFRKDLRGFFPHAEVLFNPGALNKQFSFPTYEHTVMYLPDELNFINKELGGTDKFRLSAGAVTAHWFYYQVCTMATLSFINFDFFHHSVIYQDNHHKVKNKASSWHMPIALPKYQTLEPDHHPAHDLVVERGLFETLLQNDNVYFLGTKPKEPKIIDARNVAWDDTRQRLDGKQDSS